MVRAYTAISHLGLTAIPSRPHAFSVLFTCCSHALAMHSISPFPPPLPRPPAPPPIRTHTQLRQATCTPSCTPAMRGTAADTHTSVFHSTHKHHGMELSACLVRPLSASSAVAGQIGSLVEYCLVPVAACVPPPPSPIGVRWRRLRIWWLVATCVFTDFFVTLLVMAVLDCKSRGERGTISRARHGACMLR
jgi:hypothetical protein